MCRHFVWRCSSYGSAYRYLLTRSFLEDYDPDKYGLLRGPCRNLRPSILLDTWIMALPATTYIQTWWKLGIFIRDE